MSFDVFVLPELLEKIPAERKAQIISAIKELNDPFPGSSGNKKEIKGTRKAAYRLRAGSFRIFYNVDKDKKEVYVFDILTSEQAHKKYGKL
ncbi:type II toxin-antitoxin system RelE family toxin [Methanosarcina sp. Mfa9]|uniref:type II toxin-antitoxin system RelE family toxin n=1 Tax=Methanosarcina sp. Mfa9 TaxID=3439063 RepID=UPI003F849E7D